MSTEHHAHQNQPHPHQPNPRPNPGRFRLLKLVAKASGLYLIIAIAISLVLFGLGVLPDGSSYSQGESVGQVIGYGLVMVWLLVPLVYVLQKVRNSRAELS